MLIKIYIPKEFTLSLRSKNNEILGYEKLDTNFDHVRSELKRLFTGWTEYDGNSFWVNNEKKEFSESVKIFEITMPYLDYNSLNAFTNKLLFTLNYLKSCLNQECILYTINGEGKYV